MKGVKIKNYPSKEEQFRYRRMLSHLTAGKKNGIERILIRQVLSCREHWPHRESDYKEMLFQRVVNRDAQFFKTLAEEIDYIQGGSVDDRPQAAATLRGWLSLRERTGEFPTATELFDFVSLKENACGGWKRLDVVGRNDPSLPYMRTMRDICSRLKLHLKPVKRGRKLKLRK